MIRKKVIYGHSVPYRNMCRYNSGVSVCISASDDRRLRSLDAPPGRRAMLTALDSFFSDIHCLPIMTITGESSQITSA